MPGPIIVRAGFCEIDATDLTAMVRSVAVRFAAARIDTSSYADDGERSSHGQPSDSFELALMSNVDPGSVDEVLWPLAVDGADFLVRVRSSRDPASASNPEWTGICTLLEYQPLAGSVLDLSQTTITLPLQGARIQRVTA